jgi:hypothetical protein
MNRLEQLGEYSITPRLEHILGDEYRIDENHRLDKYIDSSRADFLDLLNLYLDTDSGRVQPESYAIESLNENKQTFGGYFFIDAPHAFFLTYNDGSTSYGLATFGYGWSNDLSHSHTSYLGNNLSSDTVFLPPAPIIIQIQSVDYPNSERGKVNEFKRFVRWEKLLTHFFIGYAIKNQWTRVYMQPAEYSHWMQVRNSETGKLRYNVTPQRMGFSRQGPVWELVLPNVDPETVQL